MSSSFGFAIRPLTAEEREARALQEERHKTYIREHGNPSYYKGYVCAMGKCEEPRVFEIQYSYVTGRSGRVSYASKEVCQRHGDKYREKHGLTERKGEWLTQSLQVSSST